MSGDPRNGSKPFDLEAAAQAAAAEAEAVPFAFTYRGQEYEVPPQTTWPMSAMRALAAGDLNGALPQLLGAEAVDKLCDAGLTMGELAVLFQGIGEAAGVGGLPNLPAPALPGTART